MRIQAYLVALGMTVALGSAAVRAQENPATTQTTNTANQATDQTTDQATTSSVEEAQPAPASPAPAEQPAPRLNAAWQKALTQEFSRASSLMGKEAQGARGESLGTIKDIAFNQQGQVFVLIDVGDTRLVPVPWPLARLASGKGRATIVFNVSGEAVRDAPVVTNDQWGELDNPNFTAGIVAYYRDQAAAEGGAASPAGASQGQGADDGSQAPAQPGQDQP
jgi:sporulation protein YlmC with PRC-barrel domain